MATNDHGPATDHRQDAPNGVIRAGWVCPVAAPPTRNGEVRIDGGRIIAAGPGGRGDALELPGCALLPGFVNAHTHLELSLLAGEVPFAGDFVGWIGGVVARRPETEADAADAVSVGLEQLLRSGVTTVGDIAHGNLAWRTLASGPLRAVRFIEVFGMGPKRSMAGPWLMEQLGQMGRSDKFIPGVQPHAPYSVHPDIYGHCLAEARRRGVPLSTHLAETTDEMEFLRSGGGRFRQLLDRLELSDGSFTPPGLTPVQYAAELGILDYPTLLAHVNYVSDGDLGLLASSRCSVAYCPRAHQFFRHPPHRFREMLARGINVCAATDGAASLGDGEELSVLEELRFLRREFPDMTAGAIVEMGTARAATALGLGDRIGTIEAGKAADLVAISLDPAGPSDPLENILRNRQMPVGIWLGGQPAIFQHSAECWNDG